MFPACRTVGEGFSLPTFDLVPSDVEGFMEALWEFQSTFHDCFARSEPRIHFFDSMVGQCSKLERKAIEPIALGVEGGTIRGMQRFISDVRWDEEQIRWNDHQLVADTLGAPDGVLIVDETGFAKKGSHSVGIARQSCGSLGTVANGQVGVFAAYASHQRSVWLVIKRTGGADPAYSYAISKAPASLPLGTLVWLRGVRWAIEQCFAESTTA